MKLDLKIALLLAVICFIGGLFVIPYQMNSLQSMLPEQYEMAMESMNLPFPIISLLSAIQLTVVTFILSFIGIKIARNIGFSIPIFDAIFKKEKVQVDKTGTILAILFGMMTAFVLVAADRFYYQYKIEIISQSEPQFSWVGLLTGVLYGGVFEEVLMRLFLMSLLILIIMKVTRKNSNTLNYGFYWIAIILAAALFAAGHLPATQMLFGELSTTLIARSFLLNGIGGIFFGYLFWKKGFEYAALAHMFAHIFLQLIFIPLFY